MTLWKTYERQLIARVVADKSAYLENSDILVPEIFRDYRDVFMAYAGMLSEGRQPTITKLTHLFPAFKEDLIQALSNVDYGISVEELVLELQEHRCNEIITEAMQDAAHKMSSDDKVATLTNAIDSVHLRERSTYQSGYDIAKGVVLSFEKKQVTGIPSGFRYYDALIGGHQPTDLIIIAAETSQGKTALALNMTQQAVDMGYPVSFISLEMGKNQLMTRMMCTQELKTKNELKNNYPLAEAAASSYKGKPLHIADITNNSITHVAGLIRSAYLRYRIKLVVVDYLQLVSDKSRGSREQEIGHIARTLKNIAKELDIPVIVLSQMRRPSMGGSHVPTMARLRDSGQIEEAADVVLFIYRPEVYGIEEHEGESTDGLAQLIIAKGRNYGTGKFFVNFNERYTKFGDRGYGDTSADASPPSKVGDDVPF